MNHRASATATACPREKHNCYGGKGMITFKEVQVFKVRVYYVAGINKCLSTSFLSIRNRGVKRSSLLTKHLRLCWFSDIKTGTVG